VWLGIKGGRVRREDRVPYIQAIWAVFINKAKVTRGMSNAEYFLASKWADKDIPLPVVVRAIEEFQGKPRRLEAVEKPVEEGYRYWYQAMGGRPVLDDEVPL
jgi:hypothetical protein